MSQTGEQMSSMAVLQQQSLIKGQQSKQTVKPICTQLTRTYPNIHTLPSWKSQIMLSIQHSQVPFASRVGLYCLMIALKCLSAAQISPNLTLVCSFNILALRGLEDTFPLKQHWGNCSKVWVCSTSRWTITMFLITNDQMRTIQVQFQESKLFNTVFNKKL